VERRSRVIEVQQCGQRLDDAHLVYALDRKLIVIEWARRAAWGWVCQFWMAQPALKR